MKVKYNDKDFYVSSIETDKKWKEIIFLNLIEIWNETNRVKIIKKQVNLSREDELELINIHIL
jgi:hypothetical protein